MIFVEFNSYRLLHVHRDISTQKDRRQSQLCVANTSCNDWQLSDILVPHVRLDHRQPDAVFTYQWQTQFVVEQIRRPRKYVEGGYSND